MAMNKFMHPRNIYKSPPNFKELALQYPEFREFVHQDVTGKVSLDFKNQEALRALSHILLKKDFGIDAEIPLNKLIPTIPLRLNYILWIEDLLELLGKTDEVKGIDIGTGASCVYPLIAAKKNGWRMAATEVDSESVNIALKNVKSNRLENLIDIIHITNKEKLIEDVVNSEYDFCMCNPPFFSSTQELHPFFKARTKNRPHPKNAFCASVNEVVADGGEVEFITKLVKESEKLKTKVSIYTTMLGHKNSLPALKKLLREVQVFSFKETEFCQGNTTRWGLAWTFKEIDLRKVTDPVKLAFKKNKQKQGLIYNINVEDVQLVTDKLMCIFKDLKFVVEDVSRNKNVQRFFATAFSNTWSNQRRKRREQKRLNSSSELDSSMEEAVNDNNNEKSSEKRVREENFDGGLFKKLKISSTQQAAVFYKFVVSIKKEEHGILLELNDCPEYGNRDNLHQIMQHVKNNIKL